MIAAGSLFTSCVENTEPQGVKDLREAKADYLASLSKLREADAEKVKAEAAVQQAIAAVKQANAALAQANAEAQQIENEIQKARNEKEAEVLKAKIDSIKAKAEQDAVDAQKTLAEKQADLEKALRKIAAEAIGLTSDEGIAIETKTNALNTAYTKYNTALATKNAAAQALWQVEYNVAAGKTNFETAESYKAKIADEEDKIAEAEANIATLEALKKTPSAVKDTIDALKAKQEDLKIEKQIAVNEKSLYEASVLVEAKREFEKRVAAFEADSLAGAGVFKFVDEDEDGNDVAKAYELTDGEGIDWKFASLINNAWYYRADVEDPILNIKGFKYNYRDNTIEVGLKRDTFHFVDDWGYTDWNYKDPESWSPADSKSLTDGLDILDEIVETLNRELVVVDNIKDSTTIEDAKKAAHVADSIFDTHRDILEKGLAEFGPYKDSLKVLEALVKDTVDFKADTLDVAVEAWETADEQVKADEDSVKAALKAAAAEYIAANKKFAAVVNDIMPHQAGGNFDNSDSTSFIDAVVALGKAQAKYFGKQDSILQYSVNNLNVVSSKIAFSDLVPAGFVAKETGKGTESFCATSLYGGEGYGAFANQTMSQELKEKAYYIWNNVPKGPDAFARIIQTVIGNSEWAWDSNISEGQVAIITKALADNNYSYDKDSKVAYKKSTTGLQDTVVFAKKYTVAAVAEIAALTADKAVADSLFEVKEAALTKFNAKKALVENFDGDKNAQVDYINVYADFNGITRGTVPAADTAAINKGIKFTWTKKTFLEPSNCVDFVYYWSESGDILSVHFNSALRTILDNVDPDGYDDETGFHRIFNNPANLNLTEFAQALYKAQLVEDLGEYVPNKARLEKITAQVAKIREDVEAAIAEFEESQADVKAIAARYYGVDEDGEPNVVVNPQLTEAFVSKGEWTFGGYLLEWANELAPEYAKIVKEYNDTVAKVDQKLGDIEGFITALETAYVAWAKLDDPDLAGAGNLANIIAYFDSLIDIEEGKITTAEGKIVILKEAVAKCEAGYSPAEVELAYAKAKLAEAERLLKQAEEALARAQKEYDEVIAAYGVK